jgi:Zn-dependent M28 family amino/carboxypeptidase
MLRLLAILVLAPQAQSPTAGVSEASLRANLGYLASDALEGRATPSNGLEMAAQFIAMNFKASGLEPINGSYFQEAPDHRSNKEGMPVIKNVVGLHRGTDVGASYVIVSAHYDHLGMRTGEGDQVFNGANDDGSGTVAVMEIAKALKGLPTKRSVLFMCFFGEERGLQGSTYYGQHPLVPLVDTVANINIEMIGRTEKYSADRAKVGQIEDWTGKLGVTGYDYSDISSRFAASAKDSGIEIVNDKAASGPFFMRSDNRAMAGVGIPAHTFSVGYEDPWYHKANDEADTIQYANMTKVVKALAQGIYDLANDPVAPKWSDSEAAKPYRDAWQKLHGG